MVCKLSKGVECVKYGVVCHGRESDKDECPEWSTYTMLGRLDEMLKLTREQRDDYVIEKGMLSRKYTKTSDEF